MQGKESDVKTCQTSISTEDHRRVGQIRDSWDQPRRVSGILDGSQQRGYVHPCVYVLFRSAVTSKKIRAARRTLSTQLCWLVRSTLAKTSRDEGNVVRLSRQEAASRLHIHLQPTLVDGRERKINRIHTRTPLID